MSSEITLELKHRRNNPRNSEGAFIDLSDGSVLFAYTRYYGKSWSDIGTATISAILSTDGGRSWSRRSRTLVANEGDCNVMSPSLLRLRDGRIALFYLRTNNFHDCRMYMRTSRDEARTWNEPVKCIPAPGYFVVNNDRVVQLECGRIIIPAAYHRPTDDADPGSWEAWDPRAITVFYYSDDDGLTWTQSRDWWSLPVHSDSGMQEPGVVELGNGDLYAWARTDTGRQWETRSSDRGVTWSPPMPSAFRSPNSALSMKRILATGHLLAVWNDQRPRWKLPPSATGTGHSIISSWGRTPLVAAWSVNDCRNWRGATLIEDDPRRGFCYTAIHSLKDAVLLAYCCGGVGGGVLQDMRIRRLPIEGLHNPRKHAMHH